MRLQQPQIITLDVKSENSSSDSPGNCWVIGALPLVNNVTWKTGVSVGNIATEMTKHCYDSLPKKTGIKIYFLHEV